MIVTEDLSKQFDQFWAVNGVSLNVSKGQVLVLLGPNGAGKTTTIRMLTSILRPTRGKAMVAGYDVVTQSEQVRASVGVLTEHHGLYGRMNAEEYLEFFANFYHMKRPDIRPRMLSLLEKFGLAEARRKRLGEYSKGMRQKLALVRAMLHDPPVLLLDEPTSAMDPESARLVRDALQQLRSDDRSILLCTHNLAEAEELADRIAIIRRGKIVYNESPSDLKNLLLGPVEYEARLAGKLDGWGPDLPEGVLISERGENWVRFKVLSPETTNPFLVRQLANLPGGLVSFQEAPRSLEKAYLEAVNRIEADEQHA